LRLNFNNFFLRTSGLRLKDPSSSHPHVEENIYFQKFETAGSNAVGGEGVDRTAESVE
jgi:hypothetical protein